MPTIFSHAAVPLAAAFALGQTRIPAKLAVAGVAVAILPDIDALAFALKIPYADPFGHRGASHSLCFALLAALLGISLARRFGAGRITTFLFLLGAGISHPILDAFTDGGLGVALLWPFSDERYFAPIRPIQVSPIGIAFFSGHSLPVLRSELLWVWLPATAAAVLLRPFAKRRAA